MLLSLADYQHSCCRRTGAIVDQTQEMLSTGRLGNTGFGHSLSRLPLSDRCRRIRMSEVANCIVEAERPRRPFCTRGAPSCSGDR